MIKRETELKKLKKKKRTRKNLKIETRKNVLNHLSNNEYLEQTCFRELESILISLYSTLLF